jgi:hypothetical protein
MIDLAVVQVVAGVLVTLGSTLLAISIGFELTLPPSVKQAIAQAALEKVPNIPEIDAQLPAEPFTNYLLGLACIGAILILTGVLYGSSKLGQMRKKLKADNEAQSAGATQSSEPDAA